MPEHTPAAAHDAVEVIIAKRDRGELSDSQIDWVVDAYTRRWRWRSSSTA
jgi:thymidine phosphorylase